MKTVLGIRVLGLVLAFLMPLGFLGCATVAQKDREFLADPILQPKGGGLGQDLEEHNRPRREGSAGGNSGNGSGCGC